MSFFKSIFGAPASGSNSAPSASSAAAPASSSSNPFGQPSQQQPQQQSGFSFGGGGGGHQFAPASSSSASFGQQPSFGFGDPPQMPFMFPAAGAAAAPAPGPAARWELVGDEQPAVSPSSSNPFDDAASAAASNSAAPSARTYFTMVLHGGRLYTFGGFGDTKGRYNDLRAYDLERGRWELVANQTGEAPKPIYLHSAVVFEGQMFIFGGSVGKDSNDLYSYEFASRVWRRIVPSNQQVASHMPSPRYGHAAVVHGGHMLVVGGCRMNNTYLSDAFIYEIRTNLWRKIAGQSQPQRRQRSSMSRSGAAAVPVHFSLQQSLTLAPFCSVPQTFLLISPITRWWHMKAACCSQVTAQNYKRTATAIRTA